MAQFGQFPVRLTRVLAGGSNACGLFLPFLDDKRSEMGGASKPRKGWNWRALYSPVS